MPGIQAAVARPGKFKPATVNRFWGDRSGGVAVLFGLLLIPLIGVVALAVDYSRAYSVRGKMQAAADAAALAAKADSTLTESQIEQKAEKFLEANAGDLYGAEIANVDVGSDDQKVTVKLEARLNLTLAPVVGIASEEIKVQSEAVASTEDLEVALVLDNTGSMAPYMDDLREGATDLVETLHDNAGHHSMVKIAVVPYVGAVNIGNGGQQMGWMDQTGASLHHAEALEWMYIGYEPGCVHTPGGGGVDPGPGTGVHGSIWDAVPSFASVVNNWVGFTQAQAATPGDVPAPFNFADPCWIGSPTTLNLFDLFSQIPNTACKGCVEARPEPFDVTDDAPAAGNPDTLFVPWFWPDEIDHAGLATAGATWRTANDYLPDRLDLRNAMAPKFNDPWVGWGQANILKYNGTNGVIDEVAPDTSGPNKACADAILPLSPFESAVKNKIDGLMHWNGSGTNAAEGLAWGWRVLSPTAPFTQGKDYGKSSKVIVLMTDGVNNVDPQPDFQHLSHFSAYGYLQQWHENRIAEKTYAGFKTHADGRMAQVCANAKAEGIQIYTVAFGISDQATLDALRDCATAPPYAYTAATADDLIQAFQQVAGSLTKLRLSK